LLRLQNETLLSSAYSTYRKSGVLVPTSSNAHTDVYASSSLSLLQIGGSADGWPAGGAADLLSSVVAGADEPSLTAQLVSTDSDVPRLLGNALLLVAALTGMAVFVVPRLRTRMRMHSGLHPVSIDETDGSLGKRYGGSPSAAGYGTEEPHMGHMRGM
jgi:hypothetical protein